MLSVFGYFETLLLGGEQKLIFHCGSVVKSLLLISLTDSSMELHTSFSKESLERVASW